ncbi:hypothetical protein KCP70_22605 [Salmonella enterica subsp. enterica]|nr:hypothetical protein KCP70_22605 [Salmonella enterica subsp. enterica]
MALSKVSLAIISCIARRSFQRRTFSFARAALSRIREFTHIASRRVQVFKHHIVMWAKFTFMLHHWLRIRWRGGEVSQRHERDSQHASRR